MTSTVDLLRGMLGENAYRALETLAGTATPLSGRKVAKALDVSPTTATAALDKLREAGFATASQVGRAKQWRLNTENDTLRAWLEEIRMSAADAPAPTGMSPYATGGGGVTFERKVAVQYLAHLLLGEGAPELGDSRSVVSVAFQQAPEHSVDDLVIHAACADEPEPSLVLALAVRRAPDLVQSNESSRKLICTFVQEVVNAPADGPEYRAALVVAGPQEHAEQLAVLAAEAGKQKDAPSFFGLIRTHHKFLSGVRTRLTHIEELVRLALATLGTADPSVQLVEQRTWELLSRLTVLMPRLETPDESDWAHVTNSLIPVARGTDLYGAMRLLERLVALADEYPPKAATVDLSLLRRDAHQVLDSATRRHRQGWSALGHLHERALASVRDEIATEDSRTVHLDRSDTAHQLLQLVESPAAAVVAHGDSGVGKSALVVRTLAHAAQDPDSMQVACINLRDLPLTTVELESVLGTSLTALLGELSAPRRLLVIDGADALAENLRNPFLYLIDAAGQADVKVVAVTANDAQQVVRDTISERCVGEVASFEVPPLTDAQVAEVVAVFDELSALAADPRSRELLRRPVVVDLLVRGGVKSTPLSDADAMQQVWSGLVLRQRPERGTPDARNIALLRLAALELGQGDPLEVVGAIDPTALAGLRQDGVLRTDTDDPFAIGPQFAHDEVRRYAIARLFLSEGHPTAKLVKAGVPRWALGAARLACQALLAAPVTPKAPLRGRFAGLQQAFDDLVAAGHGDRWGDVPGEALLTLGAPDAVLREAWPMLCAEPGTGLRRLTRLVRQRLHNETGLVRIAAAEPLIALLLDDEEPWQQGKHVQDMLRNWLHALIIAETPAGYPLRGRLHDRLIASCAAADCRLNAEQAAAAAARAALPPEEAEAERQHLEKKRLLFMGDGRRRERHRRRRELPREITDELMVELLALLGPDLGEDGEAVLRRVARDAPAWAGPAVDAVLTGRALAMYRRGFLAELTEAYYINEDEDGTGFHEDGIRRHCARGLGVMTPLAAWNRGPFMALFGSDFRNGVALLNRMLNHGALARARTLAGGRRQYGAQIEDHDLGAYRTELDVAGARRTYVGDEHVWLWYRGTGVGPYSCMSALQALEQVCDQLVKADVSLTTLVAILLEDCENLAMVGLVVGLLVRHLEHADRLLDRYLTEPVIWELEFTRVAHEASGLKAADDGLTAPERRRWSLRETAMTMVLHADDQRTDELRLIGQQLVATARRLAGEGPGELEETAAQEQFATVRVWASSLDRSTYQAQKVKAGLQIQSTPPQDVVEALQARNVEMARAQEAMRLSVRYYIDPKNGKDDAVEADELISDLASAQDLLENPPGLDPSDQWDVPAAVAAAALTAAVVDGVELSVDALRFAVDTLLRIGENAVPPRRFESEDSYFEQGADRIAAQALPLLLLPAAAKVRARMDGKDGSTTYRQAAASAGKLAHALPNEVRVHLARGLDHVWPTECSAGNTTCQHETAFQLAVETMRDCTLGDWEPETGQHKVVALHDPVANSLAAAASDSIYVDRLDAAIRALGPAATASNCVSAPARELLAVLLHTHRRALLASEHDMDSRGTHALIAARALLTVVSTDDAPVFQHIDAYADNATLLGSFLCALSSAAEESADRATTAKRLWPTVIAHVIALQASGHTPFAGRSEYRSALASLLPNLASEVAYLYREVQDEPIVWWDPLAWQDAVAQWLPLARGRAGCVDQLIGFIKTLPAEEQVHIGLPWVANLVLANPSQVSNRTYLLTSWLIELRHTVADAGMPADWQRVVDALVVAGVSHLAPYSE